MKKENIAEIKNLDKSSMLWNKELGIYILPKTNNSNK